MALRFIVKFTPGARYDLDARPLELVEPFGADGIDLGNDDVGAVFCDRSGQRVAVEHVEDLRGVGHLHRGSARILVARHDGSGPSRCAAIANSLPSSPEPRRRMVFIIEVCM